MPIHKLSQDVIAQIAAGEVVERPSSVVKEMVENAIDAGATYIHIDVDGDGRRRVRIADDGMGIRADEIELAFARHATSKLQSAEDLYNIRTLGFRGEALASIASVSRLQMVTRHETETTGTLIRLEGGSITHRSTVGAPRGTVITVEQLFFNTPARLKFLRSETTEKRLIATVVARYAMAYPHVKFVLEQDGREAFRTHGSGQLLDVIAAAMGLDGVRHMIEVDDQQGDIRVYGYTTDPGFSRADRSKITLFVNGRWIQDTSLTYAVVQAYHTLLMTGRYPLSVLLVQLPPEDVDVNVHPTKAEVRFRDADAIFAAVQRAVRRAVIDHAQTPALRLRTAQPTGDRVWAPEGDHSQLQLGMSLRDPGQHARRQFDDQGGHIVDPAEVPYGPEAPETPRTLPMLRVVGQVAASYIVAEGPAGLYLVDQHAAHERILYEQFMAEYARQGTVAQFTLAAQTIQLAADEARLVEEHQTLLEGLGFLLEPFGPNVFVVRGVPAILADRDPEAVIREIVSDLASGSKPGQSAIEDKIVIRVCKQAAVKAGQILSLDQMQGLIRQLERCRTPLTCPHGRPTMIHMSSDQLARQFGRLG